MNEMLLKMLVNMIGPETVEGMKNLVPKLQGWDDLFVKSYAMQSDTLAAVTRIELQLAASAVTPELHEAASAMAVDDPRNNEPRDWKAPDKVAPRQFEGVARHDPNLDTYSHDVSRAVDPHQNDPDWIWSVGEARYVLREIYDKYPGDMNATL